MDSLNIPQGQGPAAAMGGIGTIMNMVGNLAAASSSRRAAASTAAMNQFQAAQMRQEATQAVAASQRDVMAQNLRTSLVASRAVALAAAGGGAVTDPTAEKILTDIAGYGSYNAAVALYQGEEKARQLQLGAQAKDVEAGIATQGGEDKALAYKIRAMGGLATGGASLYSKYGLGGPKGPTAEDAGFVFGDTDYSAINRRAAIANRSYLDLSNP